MKITTNYSRSDWDRFIPSFIILLIPTIFLFSSVFYLLIPYINNFTMFLDFTNNDDTLSKFVTFIKDNDLQSGLLRSQDGFVTFMFFMWFGGMIFPLLILVKFMNYIPTNWIIKKLNIEPRMKLVIFNNGKPIHKVRDLF